VTESASGGGSRGGGEYRGAATGVKGGQLGGRGQLCACAGRPPPPWEEEEERSLLRGRGCRFGACSCIPSTYHAPSPILPTPPGLAPPGRGW